MFLPTALGPFTIRRRAIDDSVNAETPGPGVTITGGPRVPRVDLARLGHPHSPSINDANPSRSGVKFRTVEEGFATGVRFYKGAGNTGAHVGHLWSATARSWPRSRSPARRPAAGSRRVPDAGAVSANTTYVVSYFAAQGALRR